MNKKLLGIFSVCLMIGSFSVVFADVAAQTDIAIFKLVDNTLIISGKPGNNQPPSPSQVTPWGITRINAVNGVEANNGVKADGTPVKVAIIDTGIDKDHKDLMGKVKAGKNFVQKGRNLDITAWNDDNGHGTHVAGTIAALDNSIGVVGAAPGVDLYIAKVLDRTGSGTLQAVEDGIEWAMSMEVDVISMSLSTTFDVLGFHSMIQSAYAQGITIVAAAGNSGGAVEYPAAYNEVIAVSATDNTNSIASFSSRGAEIDFCAPGVNVYSTWNNGGYNTLSGTSMACPHVSACAAIVIASPVVSDDSNGKWDPDEVKASLAATADTFWGSSYDNTLYGAGLVDASLQ
jgi:subtilisin